MTIRSVGIIQHGGGNLGSLIHTFRVLGFSPRLVSAGESILDADLIVLPGVGHAGHALDSLKSTGTLDLLEDRRAKERPILGICLGAQLFTRHLEEAGLPGLGWIPADTVAISTGLGFNNGWCHIDIDALDRLGLGDGLNPSDTFYFNHQYKIETRSLSRYVSIQADPSAAALFIEGPVCGVQFHPEKSQVAGRKFLLNLLRKLDES